MTHSRTAVVAGGSAGVGRAVVEALLAEGYAVGVLARGEARLSALEAEHGARVAALPCDVADAEAVDAAASTIEERLGPITVWVNAAMLTSFSPFATMSPGEFDRILQATFTGVVNGTRAALARMEGRAGARIVTVGSGLAYRAVPFQSAYCAAKHAINGFSDSIRSELIRNGSTVSISVVQLPAVNTPQFDWARNRLDLKPQPAPPVYEPALAARAVMRAVRDGPREILVGRSVLQLVFGHMIAPGYLDRKMAQAGGDMQKSERPEPGGREDNLFDPAGDGETAARGSFGARASGTGLVVDGGLARAVLFGGVPLATLCLGLLIG